jgi:acetolactate synthase-like protein
MSSSSSLVGDAPTAKILGLAGLTTAALLASAGAYAYLSAPARGALLLGDEAPKHGGDLVAECLRAHGVKFVFTLIGGHVSPVLVGAKQRGIRVVDVRHEATAVFAADAVARLSGSVGVACVTAGPGLTNVITAMKNAQMAQSALVLLGGATLGLLKGRGSLQDIDQQALFRGQCKWQVTVSRVCDLVPTLDRAFHVAASGVPGPVFVELPIDTLYPVDTVRQNVLGKLTSKSDWKSTALKWYLERFYLANLHHAIDAPRRSAPQPVAHARASRHQVQAAADLLRRAQRPLMILGSSCVSFPSETAAVAEAVRTIGVPVWLSGAARGLLGASDKVLLRHKRSEALKAADVVVLCGVPADFRLNYGLSIRANALVISINVSREQLFLNRTPTLAVCALPGNFLLRVADLLRGEPMQHPEWLTQLYARDAEREAEIAEKAAQASAADLNPLHLCQRIDAALSPKSIIVADGGDFIGTASYIVRPRGPLAWLDPGPFGTLGVGAGFAIGAKLCRPDAEVWLLWGDGSAGYSIMEYDTMVRHKIPIIGVIGNDSCWTQIARDQKPLFKDDVACNLSRDTAYERIAAACGGAGWRVCVEGAPRPEFAAAAAQLAAEQALDPHDVRAPTPADAVVGPDNNGDGGFVAVADLDGALALAKRAAAAGRPVLINALIAKSDFREGSISV